jgi:hypothetical protein
MEHHDADDDAFRYHIHMSFTAKQPIVIEGDTRALMGLVKHLCEHELTHLNKRFYDEEKMEVLRDSMIWNEEEKGWVQSKGVRCSFSDKTQSVLEEVEKALEVRVGQTDNPGNALRV